MFYIKNKLIFFKNKLNSKTSHWLIFAMVVWQIVSIYLIATGVLPDWVIWINFGLLAVLMLVLPKLEALKLFILSIPFFVVLPNAYTDTLSMWRGLILVMFVRALFTTLQLYHFTTLWRGLRAKVIRLSIKTKFQVLKPYEKLAILFFAWCALTLLWAQFPKEGIKQLLFLLNIALIYPVTIWALKNPPLPFRTSRGFEGRNPTFGSEVQVRRESLFKSINDESSTFQKESKDPDFHRDDRIGNKNDSSASTLPLYGTPNEALAKVGNSTTLQLSLTISTGLVILIGYGQLIASIVFDFYHFWQGWAIHIAGLYYGSGFANVSAYSNSWLSGNLAGLRIFSIMPSSHAFAVVCVLFLGFVSVKDTLCHKSWQRVSLTVWIAITLASLAIILSGTRGVWVGMVPALFVALFAYYKLKYKEQTRTLLAGMLLVVIFFSALPLINMGIGSLRDGVRGDLDKRVVSVVDISETSNAGRLQIWKESLQVATQNPFGVGFDNFISTLSKENLPLDSLAEQRNERYNLPQKYITAHNLYLQILVETGVVGLVLFVLMWLAFFRQMWHFITDLVQKANSYKLTAISLSLVLLWLLAYSFFDLTLLNDKILLYTFVLLAIIRSGENIWDMKKEKSLKQ